MDNFEQHYESELNSENESKVVADLLSGQYTNLIFENNKNERIIIEYEGLELNDINQNLTILKSQIELFKYFGKDDTFPCLKIGDINIPIDIFQFIDNKDNGFSFILDYDYYRYPRYNYDHFIRFLDRLERLSNNQIIHEPIESLKSNIKKQLSSFIEIRHASFFNPQILSRISDYFKSHPPKITTRNSTQYLNITVSTHNYGLEISASPAYFVTWKKFGSPTSPIEGFLIPGTYLFGGSGIGLPNFVWDTNPVDIPPNFDINITKF